MKSKRSKACDISQKVKEIVFERDGGRCVICGKAGAPNAHYIRRSQGGLGIEQNIVTLCMICHNSYDNGYGREKIGQMIHDYLEYKYYPNWKEEDLIYSKWRN